MTGRWYKSTHNQTEINVRNAPAQLGIDHLDTDTESNRERENKENGQ